MFVVASAVYGGMLCFGVAGYGVYEAWSAPLLVALAFAGLAGIFGGAMMGHRLIVCPMCQEAIYTPLLREQFLWFWVTGRVKTCPNCKDNLSSDADRNARYWQRQSSPVMRGQDHRDITRSEGK